ncbi:MAG: arginine--tRNA ligase [Bacteroidota bacterium]|nr:arginine--tRNA ligase [Bacteroidota bacterium]
MSIELIIREQIVEAIENCYQQKIESSLVQLQNTRKEFNGDITIVVFPFVRMSKKSPEQTAAEIGDYLQQNVTEVSSYNVVKGFLNLVISADYWISILNSVTSTEKYGITEPTESSKLVMVEYSSPNTNKPLHLGHIRNNLLGFSLGEIMKANGNKVVKTNIVNDRGIHICKSMYAWKMWGNGQTPENTGIKGDHLVGNFYVKFDQEYKKEIATLIEQGETKESAEQNAPSMQGAREMLIKWEAKDPETIQLWETMNSWVYAGFDVTYKELGVDFDKIYYESETYLYGKDEVLRGLAEGVFYQKEDSSIWADLTAEGLDQKILLRSDGTSVYMTQDIGTAKERYQDYPIDKMIYVVGNEQNYHFQVLSILLDKLGFEFGKGLHHFSYGMVELPQGKMKSREGTVVDADDLVAGMIEVSKKTSEELGKLDGYTPEQAAETYRMIALGALKYFILKVDPKKNMLFNPEESIDFNGNTGPFIQYTYARIRSILRKAADRKIELNRTVAMHSKPGIKELQLIKLVSQFPVAVKEAGESYSPALIANYVYELVKEFNQFYHEAPILIEENEEIRNLRLVVAENVGKVIKTGMKLLGIDVPERM